jgi:hypothetical protein
MGLVNFKHRSSGAIVAAEFPLAEMPDLVEFTDAQGSRFQAKAFFLLDYEQVFPELPAPFTDNIPGPAPGEVPIDMKSALEPDQQP